MTNNHIPAPFLRKFLIYPIALTLVILGSVMGTEEKIITVVLSGIFLALVAIFGNKLNVLGMSISFEPNPHRFVLD